MSASLLKKYSSLGIDLYLKPLKRLGYKAPKGAVTELIKQEIDAHKDEIIAYLVSDQTYNLTESCAKQKHPDSINKGYKKTKSSLNLLQQENQHEDDQLKDQRQTNVPTASNKSIFNGSGNNHGKEPSQQDEVFTYTLTSSKSSNVLSSEVVLPAHLSEEEKEAVYLRAIANRTLASNQSRIDAIERYVQRKVKERDRALLKGTFKALTYGHSPKACLVAKIQDQELLAQVRQILEPLGFLVSTI